MTRAQCPAGEQEPKVGDQQAESRTAGWFRESSWSWRTTSQVGVWQRARVLGRTPVQAKCS